MRYINWKLSWWTLNHLSAATLGTGSCLSHQAEKLDVNKKRGSKQLRIKFMQVNYLFIILRTLLNIDLE